MANSTPVRYVQLFGYQKDLNYYGNRGTSGIDGSTSTAAGIARKQENKEHILITGDTAFLYDSNALWNRNFPKNLKIIVINNAGGGIFRIIEGPDQTEELEEFFETYHHADISKLVSAFGIDYLFAENEEELHNSLRDFLRSEVPVVLEIRTKAELNPLVLKNYFKFIRSKIEKELRELIRK
jgi:2-succinyl-5-enolpyruvyl-6-hydroxy-3-cyclohexene-1-carboxylate synthase